ncbi:hypothetical protein BO83DRAFT_454757 [Aspergillus eucalypticola CBS 122712]|uniref:Secreted protein n=1 Tax=Aspergillus eucalypticola (strain CBS 122712 / IBT 29274) TaxID=1448314 RepID=A0A317WEU8_ASPEC|nr:uncharacterized protein BO83DRAFT_454757 [Aspergillus eucalypticola CBS 122712]PWY82750.1 hypothetical protein BO83DRAFT_454757 [Aspergillus eucalypticola CBS 122712]
MSILLPAKSLLIVLRVVGFLGTWGGTALDGSTQLLTEVLDDPYGRLPGTWMLVHRTFTGIRLPPLYFRCLALYSNIPLYLHLGLSRRAIPVCHVRAPAVSTSDLYSRRQGQGISIVGRVDRLVCDVGCRSNRAPWSMVERRATRCCILVVVVPPRFAWVISPPRTGDDVFAN